MSNIYRALCAELLSLLDNLAMRNPEMDGGLLRRRARAALAQPEPVDWPPMPIPGDAEGLAEVFWNRYDQPEPVARPEDEYHEDMGAVLWWRFPIDEPPYCGSPLDSEWPGYHTHFTPLGPMPIPANNTREATR